MSEQNEAAMLTNWDKEHARAWLYAHNGDEGGGLGGLWEMVADIVERHGQMARHLAAQAWDQCVEETHGRGWLHDFAKSDALGRNPYRTTPPTAETTAGQGGAS